MSDQRCEKCDAKVDHLIAGLCAKCQSIHAATLSPDRTNNSALDEDSEDLDGPLGKPFGEYELIEEVARGGMGVIYKARHVKLNRITALKMILSGRFSSKEELQRFHIEERRRSRQSCWSVMENWRRPIENARLSIVTWNSSA